MRGPVLFAAALLTAALQVPVAHLVITLPRDDATLQVDGKDIVGTSAQRELDVTPVAGGRDQHTVTTEWRPNNYTVLTRSRSVTVRRGDTLSVDLTMAATTDRARIRYVPTSEYTFNRMIRMADVSSQDIVYEPGCGDARITIAAVKAGARRGVGVDIDPDRVAEARANVKAAGLENRIEIRLGDALDIRDLSRATVVFLYMGEEFNMLIRPILWKQLPVGARVVSHRFRMGDWEPDQTVSDADESVDGQAFDVHLWRITDQVKRLAAR